MGDKRKNISPEEIYLDIRNLPGFDTSRFEGRLERPISRFVFIGTGIVFALIALVIVGRAGYLSLIRGESYAAIASNNHLRHSTVIPERGVIYDRNMKPLAYNVPGFRVSVNFKKSDVQAARGILSELAVALERDPQELVEYIEKHKKVGELFIDVIYDWPKANQIITRFKDEERIVISPTTIRAYNSSPAFAHVLGYVNRVTKEDIEQDEDIVKWGQTGRSGIELQYNETLRGRLGIKIVEMNSQGEMLSQGIYRESEPGKSVVLGIASGLQQVMYASIMQAAQDRGFDGGSAVALDARTGEVVGMVSYPGYNLNVISKGTPRAEVAAILNEPQHALFNRAVSGLYPPASMVKPFLAMGAIEENIIASDTNIITNGKLVIPNPYNPDNPAILHDWKNHGPVDMIQAIAISSNVYFWSIGGGNGDVRGLGLRRIRDYLTRFGIGQKTSIDLPNEANGIMPDENWKRLNSPKDPDWRIGDTYNLSIGQGGMLVTPIQMARAVLGIASGGNILDPRMVRGTAEPHRTQVISKKALDVAKRGMRAAVVEGTAMGVKGLPVEVAAKTGTAQFAKPGRTHSWFMGFLPQDDPELVLVINMENSSEKNLVGATFVASNILKWYTEYGLE